MDIGPPLAVTTLASVPTSPSAALSACPRRSSASPHFSCAMATWADPAKASASSSDHCPSLQEHTVFRNMGQQFVVNCYLGPQGDGSAQVDSPDHGSRDCNCCHLGRLGRCCCRLEKKVCIRELSLRGNCTHWPGKRVVPFDRKKPR